MARVGGVDGEAKRDVDGDGRRACVDTILATMEGRPCAHARA